MIQADTRNCDVRCLDPQHENPCIWGIVILSLMATIHVASAQSKPVDSFEEEYSRLSSSPSCKAAVKLFQIVDGIVAKAINERGPAASARELQDHVNSTKDSLGRAFPRVTITEIPNERQRRTLFVVYNLWVVHADANRLSSLRVFGLTAEDSDRFHKLSSMDPYVDLLSKPTLSTPEIQLCQLRLELDSEVLEAEGDTITIRAYWNVPTGWSLGGIDWELNKTTGQIRPIKTSVYCRNFECEPNEDR